MIRDIFGNWFILTYKLVDFTIIINNQTYTLPLTWIKPFNKDKATQFIIGMSFIRNQLGGLIVQGDLITIFEKADAICRTPFIREIISYIEEENELAYEREDDCELQIEYNRLELLQKKLEPIIT